MSLFAGWKELVPGVPCPIEFTMEDAELYSKEEEDINGVRKLLTLFREKAVLPVDGMVELKDYIAQKKQPKIQRDLHRIGQI
ncbi:hypothetical protein N7463_010068 [Penicillium fimorum]|uniref:Uncharacterized protein n=1 Tax=Penicillium fimorum TaxID=1882269 RepID=A0A9W9XJ69_9EURO|nr:hypothetical protein N7463_010068 [Penicillium fimorum]